MSEKTEEPSNQQIWLHLSQVEAKVDRALDRSYRNHVALRAIAKRLEDVADEIMTIIERSA